MSFVIPDPRWEEPNLLTPGRKPTGPVAIDESKTAGRLLYGLVHNHDLVTGKTISLSGGATRSADYINLDGVDGAVLLGRAAHPKALPFHCVFQIMFNASGSWERVFDSDSDDYYHGIFIAKSNTDTLDISYGDGDGGTGSDSRRSLTATDALPIGEWITCAFAFRTSTTGKMYANGIDYPFSASGTGAAMSTSTTSQGALGRLSHWNVSTYGNFKAKSFFMFDGDAPDSFLRDASLDPYSLLIPE